MEKVFSDRMKIYGKSPMIEIRRLSFELKDVANLTVGDPNFPTPAYITEAAIKAIKEGHTHYTAPTGTTELKEVVAEKLKEDNGIEADPKSEVIISAGGTPTLFSVIHTFIDPGDEVIISDPTYQFEAHTKYVGGTPILIPVKDENDFRLDPEEVNEKITAKTKMITIITPCNPTGAVMQKEDLKAIADIAIDNDLLVVSDEVYEKIIFDDNKHYSIASFPGMEDRTISLYSLSKTYSMTGMRVGYITADKKLASKVGIILTSAMLCPNSVAQKAAVAAYKDKEQSKKWIEEMMIEYNIRRDILYEGLKDMPELIIKKQPGSIFNFPNIKASGMKSYDFAMKALKRGKVIIHPGTSFGKGGEGYLRLAVTSSQETIKEGMKRLKSAFE